MIHRSMTKLGALALLIPFIAMGCASGEQTRETNTPSTNRSSRRSRAEADVTESVDLASLLTEIPEYRGRGRNLFAFGRAKVDTAPPSVTPPPPPRPRPQPTRPPEATTPPAERVDLKFAGYVETKTVAGETKKYAVLLNGSEILTGAEGDVVGNRYRIVEIGLESVTVGVQGSNTTQRIPLRAN
jgi:hypothetical protein